jgi:hypothetical protein
MNHQQLLSQIEMTAKAAKAAGQYVEIDVDLELVVVHRGEDDEFVFRHSEANELLDGFEQFAESLGSELELNVIDKDYILWQAQGW